MVDILIVEDNKELANLLRDFLQAENYIVSIAETGEKALSLYEKYGAKLIVLDIMMPEIDGWALTKEIRKKSDLPIIMLSARAEEFDLLTGFESGIDEYVTKPFSPAVLVKRVDALIKRSSGKSSETAEKKGLYIDDAAFMAFVDGKELELTLKEFELLTKQKKNSGIVLTRD